MTHGRSRSRAGVVVLAAMFAGLLSAALCSPAAAQDRLPSELITAEPLSPQQKELVGLYVDFWAKMLRGPEAPTNEQVVTARSRLIEPLNQPTTSAAFRSFYPSVVAEKLKGALSSPSLIARLNTMILVSRLGLGSDAIALIQHGLSDASPAVRYWAVKAIRASFRAQAPAAGGADAAAGAAAAAANPAAAQIDPGQRRQLLGQLETMLDSEPALEVLEQVFLAMVDLEAASNNALERVVSALHRRVALHVDKPRLAFRPETSGMQAAYSSILYAQQNRGGMNQLLDRIAAAAAKYMFLLARQARTAELSPALEADYDAMARLAYTILSQLREARNSPAVITTQFQFNQDLINHNWDAIRQAAQRFRDMLTDAPFNLDPTDVTLTQ